jgi:hypothetical protein
MFPNLFTATQDYWRKLDELEVAYQRGEVSLEKVDAQVKMLMEELGEQRRMTFNFFKQQCQNWLTSQKETIMGLLLLGLIFYAWLWFN